MVYVILYGINILMSISYNWKIFELNYIVII